MRKVFLILMVSASAAVSAQGFLYRAPVEPVKKSALYKILLPPALRQHTSADLHDTRIFDDKGNEAPYVYLSESLSRSAVDYIEYPIYSQKHFKNFSEIIVKNENHDKIGNIAFNVNNSDAHKLCAIEGSDDLKQWYSVSARQEMNLSYSNEYTSTYKSLYFPVVSYRYLRLLIDDWDAQPFKINSAGFFKNSRIAGKLNEITAEHKILQNKERKTTLIEIQTHQQPVHRIDLDITAPRFYMRRGNVYTEKIVRNRKSTEKIRQLLQTFDLSFDKPAFIDVPGFTEEALILEIENDDNPPLHIDKVTCKQLAAYLICDLDSSRSYHIKCGNRSLDLPRYDLVNFISDTPMLLPETSIGKVSRINTVSVSTAPSAKNYFESRSFMWLCIALGSIAALFFTYSILKDMNSANNNSENKQ